MPENATGLTIGIDARAATEEVAGRGRVVRELLRALAGRDEPHAYRLYARARWEQPLDGRFEWSLVDACDPWWHLRVARAANRECDVFLSTNSYLTIWFLRIPGIPIVYDLVAFEPALRPALRSAAIERFTIGIAVRRAPALLAISRSTEAALVQRFPRAGGRVVVAPLGVSPALASDARRTPDPDPSLADGFVLAVGTLEPRKNLPRLIAAYTRLPKDLRAAHQLAIVGRLGWETGETLDAVRSLGPDCQLLGAVDDAALAELYSRCAIFCYPSLGEGFGLPVLEAMAAGAAVVTSDRSSLPEVGGDAVEYVDPESVTDIADALQRLLRDPGRRAELGRRGTARAQEFTWDRTAGMALAALERAAGARRT
jgi:glycosyltransferase involved in cell wall biosynthesis